MADPHPLLSTDELQGHISNFLQDQLALVKKAREAHSHSDLLLSPDFLSALLEPGSSQLKTRIDSLSPQPIQTGSVQSDIKSPVVIPILALEARKLVFASIPTTQRDSFSRAQAKDLFDRLDVVLQLERDNILESIQPLQIHEEVLERLTIEACSTHFSYIEFRIHELTVGLQPGRGKGLVVLRLCNELIRRLSRPTRGHTVFVGRVLSLLSSVLPLGERSGVNFRGDFNIDNQTSFEQVSVDGNASLTGVEDAGQDRVQEEEEKADKTAEGIDESPKRLTDKELLDSVQDPAFYVLFWKIQAWFSNPSLLFNVNEDVTVPIPTKAADPIPSGTKSAMTTFRITTRHVLSVFGAVGRKAKELEGKAERGKHERDIGVPANGLLIDAGSAMPQADSAGYDVTLNAPQDANGVGDEDTSFFPKYLTGRNLFEYELRDATFRRHVLAQYLILMQFLLSFTQSQKDKRKGWKNKIIEGLGADFVLEESDDRWIRDTWKEIFGLLRDMSLDGKLFADSMLQLLKREARWIQWKGDNCPPIDRAPLSGEEITAFATARKGLSMPMRAYPHTVGTAALSRLWEDGVRKPEKAMRIIEDEEGMEIQVQTDGLDELELAPLVPTLESYAGDIKRVEEHQAARRAALEWQMPQTYAIGPAIPLEKRREEVQRISREAKDEKMRDLEQTRVLQAWRAARLARAQHLDSFAKMKMDDGKTLGVRVDDISRLMKAVAYKSRPAEQAPTPMPMTNAPITSSSNNNTSTTRDVDVEMKESVITTSSDSEMAQSTTSTMAAKVNDQGQIDTATAETHDSNKQTQEEDTTMHF